jgi:hypothetical protein
MNDENTHVNYANKYTPEAERVETVEDERVFGATAVVDGNKLIYDETNELWVYDSGDREDIWYGTSPVLLELESSDTPVDATPVEVGPDPEMDTEPIEVVPEEAVTEVSVSPDTDTYLTINTKECAKLRLREDSSTESDVVDILVPENVMRVLNSDNPEWYFVEVVNGNTPMRGYVKKSLVVESPAPPSA